MATEGGGKEMNEIKTQFTTREGLYKLLPHSEYSRPNRVPFNSQGSNPVRVSFVNLNDQSGNGDRLCFNVGRELYFYIYKGVRKENEAQLSLKNCHSKQGPIKLFDRVDAISSNHFKIRPSILSYSISSNLDSNPVKYKKASSFHS
ncbi:WD repeat-containing protein 20 isoform X8 [Mustela lutreola]|uniref:WD repeat-containing protein 20 isoform X6 n=2 Tax=Mustelinae TaxID=169418 RepID=A0A8U0NUR7_MUSPF|nr:WD repeat-containing protein 20 isoform X6 [Mustela putorius furo]XP_044085487.1 WD repeat-containing protein 20 isoform X6 [Neogale vison]XP_059039142.1 WD repeat-containing protein 20 isoform X8 [Mustela lutreola]XP_059039143.1 WD repeat-containing protein 20 isoform X8 [Mustela lutreola]